MWKVIEWGLLTGLNLLNRPIWIIEYGVTTWLSNKMKDIYTVGKLQKGPTKQVKLIRHQPYFERLKSLNLDINDIEATSLKFSLKQAVRHNMHLPNQNDYVFLYLNNTP